MEAHFAMPGDDWGDVLEGDPEQESQPVVWPLQVGCPEGPKIHEFCVLMCSHQSSFCQKENNPFGKKFRQQLLHRLHRNRESTNNNMVRDDDLINMRRSIRTPLSQKDSRVNSETMMNSPHQSPKSQVQSGTIHHTSSEVNNIQDVMFVSQGCHGIVDLGASQTVMGEYQLGEFLRDLPEDVRAKVREQKVSMTFRFGNISTVACDRAILVPVQRYWIRIAIVKSRTPFLLSNSMFRKLGAIIDTKRHAVHFEEVPCTVPLSITDRKLFTLSVAELIEVAQKCGPSAQTAPNPENVLIAEDVTSVPNKVDDNVGPSVPIDRVQQVTHTDMCSQVKSMPSSTIKVTNAEMITSHVAVVPKASTPCCQTPVTVCDDLCHVETAGSPQSFQASEDRTEQFRERTRVDQPINGGPARKDHSFRSNSFIGLPGTQLLEWYWQFAANCFESAT